MQSIDFTGIPPVRFNTLAQYAGIISVYKIARMSPARRTAMLIAFVCSCEISALDDTQDVLEGVIADIGREAKKNGSVALAYACQQTLCCRFFRQLTDKIVLRVIIHHFVDVDTVLYVSCGAARCVTNDAKLGLPQLGWNLSGQRTHNPSPQ